MTKMNITFFMGNEVSNSSSHNNFFEDSIILKENSGKFFLGRGGENINISIFYVKNNDNTIETIDGFAKTIDSFQLLSITNF